MNTLPEKDIIQFLKNNIEPLDDSANGNGYRASVTLRDGTILPCVVFRSPSNIVNLAIKRFKEEQSGTGVFSRAAGLGYWQIVKTFVASGNCINAFDIAKVDFSRFAFPLAIQKQIRGETSMGWTAFVAKFKDGRHLGFGTPWNVEFFDLPNEFNTADITEIINNSYLLKSGEIVNHRSFDRLGRKDEMADILIDRTFFDCYLEGL